MGRLLDALERAALVASGVALALLAAGVSVFVILRYGFGVSPFWSEEVLRLCLLAAVFLGAAISVRRREHIRVEFLANLLPPWLRRAWYAILDLVTLGIFVLVVATGIEAVQFNHSTRTAALQVRLSWILWLIPAGFALAALFQIEAMARGRRDRP
jgi:C4-dicarboxylate transporter DctQ subunit